MFSIIEIQTDNGRTAHLCQTADTKEEAMSKYHMVLASAAVSEVDYHSCVVLNEMGITYAVEGYCHIPEEYEEYEE